MAPMPRSPDGGHEACRGRAIVPRSNLVEDPWEVPGETRLGLSHEPGEPTRNAMPVFARFVGPFAYSAICCRDHMGRQGRPVGIDDAPQSRFRAGSHHREIHIPQKRGDDPAPVPHPVQSNLPVPDSCCHGHRNRQDARCPPLRVVRNPLRGMLSRISHSTQKWGFHATSQR